jgi:PIN domain nuclease of toxin-antitoxin system
LLDAHIFIWTVQGSNRLEPKIRADISARTNEVLVSVVRVRDIAIKARPGKLRFPLDDIDGMLASNEVDTLGIQIEHAVTAGGLPRHHDEPLERMIIAQARVVGLTVVTANRAFARYDVPLLGQTA